MVFVSTQKKFCSNYGYHQDHDIRTKLIFLVKLVYNMSILRGKNFSLGLELGYNCSKKNFFLVTMETYKTKKFGLSSKRGSQKYIICLCSDKKIFSLGLELGYPILLQQKKFFLWLLWRRPRPLYSYSARREVHKNI